MTRLRSSPLLLALGAAAALAVVVLAWVLVRGGDNGAGPDPARVTPPRVAIFGEVSLRAGGEQGASVRRLLARVASSGDPDRRLADLVGKLVEGSADAGGGARPWLGSRAGFFFRAVDGPRSRGTLLLAAADEERARADLVTAGGAGVRRSYRGVRYALRPGGTAAAVVDGFAVIGDEGGVRASIDAARDHALGGSDRYRNRVRRIKVDRLGSVYFDLLAFGDLLGPPLVSRDAGRELRERLSITDPDPVVAVVSAKARALILDFGPRPGEAQAQGGQQGAGGGEVGGGQGVGDTPPGEAGGEAGGDPPVGAGGGEPGREPSGPEAGPGSGSSASAPVSGLSLLSTPLLPELPSDAWLALGVPDFGQRVGALLDPRIDQAVPLDELSRVVRRLAGPRVRERLVPALGGMAIFVRGTRPDRLEGAAVVESLDPAATGPAIRSVARGLGRERGWRVERASLRGAPGAFRIDAPRLRQPVFLFARGNRIVAAAGRSAAIDALDAQRKLGSTPGFRAASAILAPSLRPDSYLRLGPALRVLGRTFLARTGAYEGARAFLEPFSYIVFASRNRIRRFALGVE